MKKKIILNLLIISILALGMTGCQTEDTKDVMDTETVVTEETENAIDYESYMTSIQEQSDSIKNFLENDAVTQLEMNEKSKELYELWDGALNYLWGELKKTLPEEEFEKLREKQRAWIEEKEETAAEAGKEFEGGSMYSMVVDLEAAAITEERVSELYELLK